MTRTTATLCLISLLAAGPGWSQSLAPEAQKALGAALQDERHAEAFYASVMDKFGALFFLSRSASLFLRLQSLLMTFKAHFGSP